MVVKTELLIRRGFSGEFVSMAALAVRAWRIAARDIELTTERQEVLEARFQRDLQEIADGVLAAEKAGILAGWGARVPQSNYISDLWVDPPHHGQGIGRQILDALMAQILLDGFDEALIGTHADNLPAINLYKKAGFRIDWQGDEWSESFERTVEKVRMRADL
ncbi:GNAT family N-acetyltransferase [Brucella cytisi]|uniref:GNAT family N-acetyltransferase n=2 Tax=Brucella cytisi TaxID=407152 RepID=A0A1J6HC81_9HYPH|nr:GNAT family N-acetyltransferase [Brucella cytisi]